MIWVHFWRKVTKLGEIEKWPNPWTPPANRSLSHMQYATKETSEISFILDVSRNGQIMGSFWNDILTGNRSAISMRYRQNPCRRWNTSSKLGHIFGPKTTFSILISQSLQNNFHLESIMLKIFLIEVMNRLTHSLLCHKLQAKINAVDFYSIIRIIGMSERDVLW